MIARSDIHSSIANGVASQRTSAVLRGEAVVPGPAVTPSLSVGPCETWKTMTGAPADLIRPQPRPESSRPAAVRRSVSTRRWEYPSAGSAA